MENSPEDLIRVGVNVDIQRTDGRIHSAVISGVNLENKSVTVEWFERGETKGKEIELEAVFALNPDLNVNEGPTNNPPPPIKKAPPSKISTRQTLAVQNAKGSVSVRQSYAKPLAPHQQNGHSNSNAPNIITPTSNMPPPAQLAAVQKTNATQGRGRRSNCVKEVEKLKKERESRRVRQLEQKAVKQELMNVDPGNPNWEFLSMIREYQANIDFNVLTSSEPVINQQICVAVRKRPLNKKELNKREIDVVTVPTKDLITIHEPKLKVDLTKYVENQMFRFDYAFDDTSDNNLVYKYTAKPLIGTIFDGGMATCFAYGQTGSGKTHTMGGEYHGKSQDCSNGIYAFVGKIFAHSNSNKCGKVFDLLNNKAKLRVLEDGNKQVNVIGLQERICDNHDSVLKLIALGNNVRTSGQTSANQNSSRSHAVFQISLKKRANGRLKGKFSLIDLAGNERGADTMSANRQVRMEGAEINKSLLALKECIRALGRKGAHLPFRASKLTQVLRDSFIGEKSRTCMIAMISPGWNSCEHSINTLRYADRVKELGVENSDPRPIDVMENIGHNDVNDNEDDDDDLAVIRSTNAGELSADLYTFHEAVSHLQEIEEEVQEIHKTIIDENSTWHKRDCELYAMSNQVDYDVEAYSENLEALLTEKLEILSQIKDKVTSYRQQLTEEEKISKTIKPSIRK
ncbi:Kinesin-like protein KIF2A [Nymphon striatum]|nr:Kinesin-like protein KIF2A [Nymphon striatum]